MERKTNVNGRERGGMKRGEGGSEGEGDIETRRVIARRDE